MRRNVKICPVELLIPTSSHSRQSKTMCVCADRGRPRRWCRRGSGSAPPPFLPQQVGQPGSAESCRHSYGHPVPSHDFGSESKKKPKGIEFCEIGIKQISSMWYKYGHSILFFSILFTITYLLNSCMFAKSVKLLNKLDKNWTWLFFFFQIAPAD